MSSSSSSSLAGFFSVILNGSGEGHEFQTQYSEPDFVPSFLPFSSAGAAAAAAGAAATAGAAAGAALPKLDISSFKLTASSDRAKRSTKNKLELQRVFQKNRN